MPPLENDSSAHLFSARLFCILFGEQRGRLAHCPKITPLSYFPWKYPPPCESVSVIVSTYRSRNCAHLCMSVPAECLYVASYFTSIMKGEEHRTCRYPLWRSPQFIWCMKNARLDLVSWFLLLWVTVCLTGSYWKNSHISNTQWLRSPAVLERYIVSLPLCSPWSPCFYCTWAECWIRPLSLSCHADPITPSRLVNFCAGWLTCGFFQRQNAHIMCRWRSKILVN